MAKSNSLERFKLRYRQTKNKQKYGLSKEYFEKIILDNRRALKRRNLARRYAKFRKNIVKRLIALKAKVRG